MTPEHTITIPLSQLDDKKFHIREGLDQARVEEFADIFDRLPPIETQADPLNGQFAVLDGMHRLAAARRLGRERIEAIVHNVDDDTAFEIAARANVKTSLPLKTKERKALAREYLRRFTERSNNWIAEDVGLSDKTITSIRSDMEATSEIPKLEVLTGKDGKERPVTYADREPAPDPEPAAEPEPVILPYIIHCADARTLADLDIDPVHLVVTSPPYNVGIGYNEHDDAMPEADYYALLMAVWEQCHAVMVPGARIAVVVPFGIGRNPWVWLAPEVSRTLQAVGFTLRGQIIWDKGTSGGRTAWGSFRLPTDPGLRDTTECIIVAHKGQSNLPMPEDLKRHDTEGTYSPFLENQEFFMQLAQDHWVVPPESAQRVGHPAPFPAELADRLIRFYAYPGAHILDPFAGSGSTGVAAVRRGCQVTLVELDEAYCSIATERCKSEFSKQG